MRPRVFPPEDMSTSTPETVCTAYASMRPRVFPAEDAGTVGGSSVPPTLQ